MIDLHMHTKYSDGTDDIHELLQNAERSGLDVISITDHNNVKEYFKLEEININDYFHGKIIAGIELTTRVINIPIEVLGYNIDYKLMDKILPSMYLTPEQKNKTEFTRLLKKCNDAGMHINNDRLSQYDPLVYPSIFIHSLLIEDEYNKQFIDEDAWESSNTFYRKYMSNPDTLLYVDINDLLPDLETVIKTIRECGGLVFLPHIFEYRDNSYKILNHILNNYIIDGLECYYTTFSDEQSQELLKICKERNLLVSGGSDYHGTAKPNIKMGIGFGNMNIPSDISILKDKKIKYIY